jgi:hypothetical protein
VYDSRVAPNVTPCPAAASAAAARIASAVSARVSSSAARASSQARTAEFTPLAPPGSAMTFPNVATAPCSAASRRAASTVLA